MHFRSSELMKAYCSGNPWFSKATALTDIMSDAVIAMDGNTISDRFCIIL